MKNFILILVFALLSSSLVAQVDKPHKPMSRFSYNIYTKRLEKSKSEERRMKKGVRMMKFRHISSNQLYKASGIFTDDSQRLIFVKKVFPKISDKSNAIIICDAFDNFSNSTILWEYIKTQNKLYGVPEPDMNSYTEYLEMKDRKKDKQKDDLANNSSDKTDTKDVKDDKDVKVDVKKDEAVVVDKVDEIVKTDNQVVDTNAPEVINGITFPSPNAYIGNKGCDSYLNDKQFLAFANSLAQFPTDEEKAKICMEYVYTYCFNTAQVMKLSLMMGGENFRYIFLKTAYEKVYDKDNFLYVKQLLMSSKLKSGINEIYIVPGTNKPYAVAETEEPAVKCFVSDSDFEKIRSEIRKESFSTTRLEVSKRLVKDYSCLSSSQIKDLLPLFSLEADKLEMAKFSYKYCLDRKNYSVVTGFFTAQASKNEINEYINAFSE